MYGYMCVCVFVTVYVCMCVQVKQRMDEQEYSRKPFCYISSYARVFVCLRRSCSYLLVCIHLHISPYTPAYTRTPKKKHLHSETSSRDPSHKPRLACNSATLPSPPSSTRVSSGKAHRRNQLPERPPNTRRDCRRKPHFRLPWRPESGLRERSVRLNH